MLYALVNLALSVFEWDVYVLVNCVIKDEWFGTGILFEWYTAVLVKTQNILCDVNLVCVHQFGTAFCIILV